MPQVWTNNDEVWSSDTESVTAAQGSAHCDMQSLTIIRIGGHKYVRDPDRMVPAPLRQGAFDADVPLPADAADTGLRSGDKEMWKSADDSALYVVQDAAIERWPQVDRGYGCD